MMFKTYFTKNCQKSCLALSVQTDYIQAMILHALIHHLNGDNNILSKTSLAFNNHNYFQNLKSQSYLKLKQSLYCESSLD